MVSNGKQEPESVMEKEAISYIFKEGPEPKDAEYSDIVVVVAGSELPPFLLEMILGEMLAGISNVARKEYSENREAWEKACKEGGENGGH